MCKRIISLILSIILSINIVTGTVLVSNTVPVYATAVDFGMGYTVSELMMSLLFTVYGYVVGVDVADGWTADANKQYDVSEEYVEWLTAGVICERAGYTPSAAEDPRTLPPYLTVIDGTKSDDPDDNNKSMNDLNKALPFVAERLFNGVPDGDFWKFDNYTFAGSKLSLDTIINHYTFTRGTDGLYTDVILNSSASINDFASSNAALNKCIIFEDVNMSDYSVMFYQFGDGVELTDKSYLMYASYPSYAFNDTFYFEAPGHRVSWDQDDGTTDLGAYESVAYESGKSFAVSRFLGYRNIYTNLVFDPSTSKFICPVNALPDPLMSPMDSVWVENAVDNGYTARPPEYRYNEDGVPVGVWDNYEPLTKDDLKEILTDPKLIQAYVNTFPVEDSNGDVIENINQNLNTSTLSLSNILKAIKNLPKNIWNKFQSGIRSIAKYLSSIFGQIQTLSLNLTTWFSNLGADVFLSFENALSAIESVIGNISMADVVSAVKSITLPDVVSAVKALPASIAESISSIFVPTETDLATLKDSGQKFFNQHFGMPATFFDEFMIEGKDLPDFKMNISGKEYIIFESDYFNDFVEDFRKYIQMVFVIIYIFWLSNQVISIFDKSGVIGGRIDDIDLGKKTKH